MSIDWVKFLVFYVILAAFAFYVMTKDLVPVFLGFKWDNSTAFIMVVICLILAVVWPVALVLFLGFFAARGEVEGKE